jgi:hypothetical protein
VSNREHELKRRGDKGCQTLGDGHTNTIAWQAGAGTRHHTLMQKMPLLTPKPPSQACKGANTKHGEPARLIVHGFQDKNASSPIDTGARSYHINSKQAPARGLSVSPPFRRKDSRIFPDVPEDKIQDALDQTGPRRSDELPETNKASSIG